MRMINAANIITAIRILCGIMLIFCTPFSAGFCVIYIIGGLSDVFDGFVARRFNIVSKFGARLDTVADMIFVIVVIIKLLSVVHIPIWLIIWGSCIAAVKCISVFFAVILKGKFIAEHTLMNKICGGLLFLIPLCIYFFPGRPVFIILIFTCMLATFAAIQELYYIRTGKEVD